MAAVAPFTVEDGVQRGRSTAGMWYSPNNKYSREEAH
jgi:hypothetical protein